MKKKGQAAMEYLMTYGWAILIVIIVIAALWAMGVFTVTSPVTCSPCFSYFAFRDYQDGTLLIVNGPEEINITAVTGATAPTAPNNNFKTGKQVTLTGVSTSGDVDITITYDVIGGLTGHTDTATIHNA